MLSAWGGIPVIANTDVCPHSMNTEADVLLYSVIGIGFKNRLLTDHFFATGRTAVAAA